MLNSQEIEIAEEKRRSNKKRNRNIILIFGVISIVSAGLILALDVNKLALIISAVLLIVPFGITYFYKGKLVKFVKSNVILPALKKLRPNLTYQADSFVTHHQFKDSNLFDRPDRYDGEDLISGESGETEFSFSEIHAEKKHTRTDSKGRTTTSYSTIFKGIFMIAEFNKEIKNETYVLTSGNKWFSKFKRVKLEDPDFEARFNVYSDNQIEARYILSATMMEKITNLEIKFNCKLYMSFIGDTVYIALGNSNNYFEPKVNEEITEQTVNDVVAEIDYCISIIDDLNLNTRIWTKK